MKLYFCDVPKMFTFLKPVAIWDEDGNRRYTLKNDESLTHAGYRLHLMDSAYEEVALIRQKLLTLTPRFYVDINGEERLVSLRRSLKGKSYFNVSGTDWKTEGDVDRWEYEIKAGDRSIAFVHASQARKKACADAMNYLASAVTSAPRTFSKENCCEIDISDGIDEAEVLAVILAVVAAINVR